MLTKSLWSNASARQQVGLPAEPMTINEVQPQPMPQQAMPKPSMPQSRAPQKPMKPKMGKPKQSEQAGMQTGDIRTQPGFAPNGMTMEDIMAAFQASQQPQQLQAFPSNYYTPEPTPMYHTLGEQYQAPQQMASLMFNRGR